MKRILLVLVTALLLSGSASARNWWVNGKTIKVPEVKKMTKAVKGVRYYYGCTSCEFVRIKKFPVGKKPAPCLVCPVCKGKTFELRRPVKRVKKAK